MRLIALLVIILVVPVSAAAQKTPWGDPDLQGTWSNQTPVPLERPAALGSKASFTKAEAADYERTALERLLGLVAEGVPTSGELNEVWLETQKGKVAPSLSTSLVVHPPDGRIPYTPEGRKRWEATPTLERVLSGGMLYADGPEDRPLDERCITTGGLFVPNPFYNNYHQIVQAQGYVAILTEMMHEMRIVPLDGRPPVNPIIGQWLGDSRGRWKGKRLSSKRRTSTTRDASREQRKTCA